MQFTQIVAPTIRELFIDRMVGTILSGRLKIGERLPSERELSQQMNVSKSIVHLGLEDLRRMGFVRVEPRSGTYVANFVEQSNLETLSAIFKYTGGVLGRDTQLSLVELRDAIEGAAVVRLSKTRTPEAMAELRAMVEHFRLRAEAGAGSEELGAWLADFACRICVLSGNQLFPMLMSAAYGLGRMIWEACADFRPVDEAVEQSSRLLDLIEQGRGREAADYLSHNLANYVNNPLFLNSPDSTFEFLTNR